MLRLLEACSIRMTGGKTPAGGTSEIKIISRDLILIPDLEYPLTNISKLFFTSVLAFYNFIDGGEVVNF